MRRAHPSADVTATTDVDLLTGKTISETLSPNATVKLPFHHLTSKVRFAIYTTEHVSPTLTLPITDVKITAESSSGFVTSYESYSSSVVPGQSVLNGACGGTQATTSVVDLLTFSGPTDGAGTVKYSDAYLEKHEWTSPTEVNAYFFECSDGIIQMPQAGVKLRVTMKIGGKEFDRIKQRVRASIAEMTINLKRLYKARKEKKGNATRRINAKLKENRDCYKRN